MIDPTGAAQHQRPRSHRDPSGGPSASLLRWLLLTCGAMVPGAYAMAHDELEELAMAKMRVVIYLRGEDDRGAGRR